MWERAGVPVSVGRSLRIVPERTRRLVLDRDRGCRFPGCVATAHLEVHHVVHWAHGGRTDLDNLVALCPFHHDAHHAGEFGIGGDANGPGGLVFTARGGFPIGPGPLYAPVRLTRERPADREPLGRRSGRRHRGRAAGDPDRTREMPRTGRGRRPGPDPGWDAGPDVGGDPGPDPGRDGGWDPAPGRHPGPDAEPALELGVGYPGATGEVLQGKWVTFHEADPVPI